LFNHVKRNYVDDHFTNFFYNNLPQFCVGMIEQAEGPAETYCAMPHRVVKGEGPEMLQGKRIVTLDIGGTSADVAFHSPAAGIANTVLETQLAGRPVAVPPGPDDVEEPDSSIAGRAFDSERIRSHT